MVLVVAGISADVATRGSQKINNWILTRNPAGALGIEAPALSCANQEAVPKGMTRITVSYQQLIRA